MNKWRSRELLQHVRCPECGVPMMERVGKKGEFYGCSRFPICIGTRPKGGDGVDSYTALLRTAYGKAVRFLSSAKFMGFTEAPRWMLTQALGHEVTEEEFEDSNLKTMANDHVERGVDTAGAWLLEQGEVVDFLLNAHEERYAHVRARLRFDTTAEQIRRMPKPEVVRRYDTSDLTQLEAYLASAWNVDGIECPRCDSWAAAKDKPDVVQVSLEELFDTMLKDSVEKFECGRCGLFERVQTSASDMRFVYEDDKNNPNIVPGVVFKTKDFGEDKSK